MDKYIQCDIKKGDNVDTAWLEDKNLKVGNIVELKLGEGARDPGWEVMRIYGSSELSEINKDGYKKHRNRTDV